MDRIACLLGRKIYDVQIDPILRRIRGFVIAQEVLGMSEDIKIILAERVVGSGPTINLRGQGTQGLVRRN